MTMANACASNTSLSSSDRATSFLPAMLKDWVVDLLTCIVWSISYLNVLDVDVLWLHDAVAKDVQ